MQISKDKLKRLGGYFILSLACIGCGAVFFFDIGNDKTQNEFSQIQVHVAFPIKHIIPTGRFAARPYLLIYVKEYPLYYFEIDNWNECTLSEINLSELKNRIFTGDKKRQGDSIALTIYADEARRIKQDIVKLHISTYDLDKEVEILGLSHHGTIYKKFDLDQFNANENSNRTVAFCFWTLLGIIFFLVGRYRWKKNKRW